MRYLISISYDGSRFYGFQKLKGKDTIQFEIEKALSKLDKNPVVVKGSGRTDRGVHAYDQNVHFDLKHNIPAKRLKNAINDLVGDYILVNDCQIVPKTFHARFDVKEKEYVYKISTAKYDPLLSDYYLQIKGELNIIKMKKCASLFIGVHDFRSFVAGKRDNNEAIINDIKITKKQELLTIKFRGKSFYRYMVRNLVGAIIDVGLGKTTLTKVKELLKNQNCDVELTTAPACGLYLMKVKY